MAVIPSWFGVQEFYFCIVTIWLGLGSWIIVNLIRVKLNVKKKIVSFKQWLEKRKELKEQKLLGELP